MKIIPTQRIVLALVIAPLILAPITLIPSILINLYNGLTEASYHGHFRFFGSQFIFIFPAVLVAFVVTLVYGLPTFLILRKYTKATLPYLSLAGVFGSFLFSLYPVITSPAPFKLEHLGYILISSYSLSIISVIVAITFWMIATPHKPKVEKRIKIAISSLFSIAFVLIAIAWVVDEYLADDLKTASIERAFENNAPPPEWWDSIVVDKPFSDILDARSIYLHNTSKFSRRELTQEKNRRFFKRAYITLQDIKLNPDIVAELVILMDLPYIDYPHMFELQKYALFRPAYSLEVRMQLLMHMLTTSSDKSEARGYATSLSYDLITESAPRLNKRLLGNLCTELSENYNGRPTNYFEISIFDKCITNLSIKPTDTHLQKQIDFIKLKRELMKANSPNYKR